MFPIQKFKKYCLHFPKYCIQNDLEICLSILYDFAVKHAGQLASSGLIFSRIVISRRRNLLYYICLIIYKTDCINVIVIVFGVVI